MTTILKNGREHYALGREIASVLRQSPRQPQQSDWSALAQALVENNGLRPTMFATKKAVGELTKIIEEHEGDIGLVTDQAYDAGFRATSPTTLTLATLVFAIEDETQALTEARSVKPTPAAMLPLARSLAEALVRKYKVSHDEETPADTMVTLTQQIADSSRRFQKRHTLGQWPELRDSLAVNLLARGYQIKAL